ncbi:MAG TPA: ABC transporter [Verrucomicrobiae bacterium]|nr:ABC transporter [Verrucomicrobiae bacterium]
MATKYQLVLQFQGDTLTDYDAMIKLENLLIKKLGHSAKVDGHDCGSGETNIFIFTFDPALTFLQSQARPGERRKIAISQSCLSGYRM